MELENFCVKGIYGSGMVLQRETTNCIFGCGPQGKKVELEFRGKKYSCEVDSNGKWKIEYDSLSAGGPFEIKLVCDSSVIIYTEVFVGEVWINSGQSNAQLPMERLKFSYKEEFTAPKNDYIRMITVPISWTFDGERDSVESVKWICACPESIGEMSGTGYFFAKKLSSELKMPVGIVNASQGGSPISAWMSKTSLQELDKNEYLSRLAIYEKPKNIVSKQREVAEAQKKWEALLAKKDIGTKKNWSALSFNEIQDDWTDCVIPGFINDFSTAGFVWIKKEIVLTVEQVNQFNEKKGWLWLGTIVDADKVWINGKEIGITYYSYPPRRYQVLPGTLKEGKNTITVRLQKNSKWGKIRFYEEKPYYLFTQDVKVHPVAVRNVECCEKKVDSGKDGLCISLSGNWKMKVGCSVKDGPAGMFFEWVPTALYNAMLAPCFNYAVAGSLWYQGESDAGRFAEYDTMLNKMMELWRSKFVYAKKDMPFVIMQLPNWSDGWNEDSEAVFSDWALLREAQAKAVEKDSNSALAVTIDAGEWNDLHPEKKLTCGTRAAEQALRIAYGKNFKAVPTFAAMTKIDETHLELKFNLDGSKLKACKVNGKAADLSVCDTKVYGFSVLYKDGNEKITAVEAVLKGDDTVTVLLPVLKGELIELRYLWAQNPAPVNLYSAENLPVVPFRVKL